MFCELRVFLEVGAGNPRAHIRSGDCGVDYADGDVELFRQAAREDVGDCFEAVFGVFWRAHEPACALDAVPLGVFADSVEAFHPRRSPHIEIAYERIVRVFNKFLRAVRALQSERHIALSARNPHFADEHVGDCALGRAVLVDRERCALRRRFHRRKLYAPRAVRSRRRRDPLVCECDFNLGVRRGFAPHVDRLAALQNHRVREYARQFDVGIKLCRQKYCGGCKGVKYFFCRFHKILDSLNPFRGGKHGRATPPLSPVNIGKYYVRRAGCQTLFWLESGAENPKN